MTDGVLQKIGKYEILEQIGRGGMGTIFKAHDPVLDRLVALKVISTDGGISDDLRARFFREGQACALLNHPNIVTVYAMGDEEGRLFIVMELLEGEDLKSLIGRRAELNLEDKLSIMVQACSGLHYAHRKGIVHRDIKPGNIFVQQRGPVKILDFGIAHIATAASILTRSGLVMGSLRYMSPEQARGRVDHRSDIFSLGAVFYELLSLRLPFAGEDPMQILELLRTKEPPPLEELVPGIPSPLVAAVARAMRKDPAERFGDLEAMGSQLQDLQRVLAAEARPWRIRTALASATSAGAAPLPDAGPSAQAIGGLEEMLEEPPGSAPRLRRRGRGAVATVAAGVVALIALVAVLWPWATPPPDQQLASLVRPWESVAPARPEARVEAKSAEPSASAAPAPSPPPVRDALTAREALREAFKGRDPAHTVIAAIPQGALRIGRDSARFSITSARPGYLYVLGVRGAGSDVVLLFPNAVDSENRIEAGQPMPLPGPKWTMRAQGPAGAREFLAIVFDEPRDLRPLGPVAGSPFGRVRFDREGAPAAGRSTPLLAGALACPAAPPCSESYGAVVFSIDVVGPEPSAVQAARRGPAPTTTAEPPAARRAVSPGCSSLLERASLGESLTDEEKTMLTRNCR